MWYGNAEDRLNPIVPEGVDDTTLGGYPAVHGRAPSFEGSDGAPYTAAVEVEPAEEGDSRWVAYLIFVRWSENGTAVMGHLETEDLAEGASEAEVRDLVERLSLSQVKALLEETILRKRQGETEW